MSRLTNVFRGDRLDRDLRDELQHHIEERAAELEREGMAPGDAVRAAQRRFGNQLALRESSREAKLLPWLESLLRDVRFGFRVLRKDRTVTVAAVLSLSLAIGACIAAFSLMDALILRPLPLPEPSRLVSFSYAAFRPAPGARPDDDHFSYPLLQGFRAAAGEQVALFGMTVWGALQPAVFDGAATSAGPERLRTQWISGNGLETLGVRPTLGRLLTSADEQMDQKGSVAVLSYGFWMRRFAGNPAVLGREFSLSGVAYQIVGVAQKDFSGVEPGYLIDVWLPLTTAAPARQLLNASNDRFAIFGRLNPGVQPEQVRQILQAVFTNSRQEQAAGNRNTRLNISSAARGHETFLRWQFEKPLWILAGVVGLVLLIACSNVANLLVARGAARGREMAMRSALGAGRARLVQQVLIESSLLAGFACIVGLGIASWITPVLIGLMGTSGDPAYLDVSPNGRVLAFLAVVGLLTTSLFGLAPAVRASAAHATEALKDGSGKLSARMGVLRPVLAAQVGLSFVVLFVAGLLLISFQRLTSVDLGFSQKNLLIFSMDSGARQPRWQRCGPEGASSPESNAGSSAPSGGSTVRQHIELRVDGRRNGAGSAPPCAVRGK